MTDNVLIYPAFFIDRCINPILFFFYFSFFPFFTFFKKKSFIAVMLIMTGIPPQHDIIKHNIIFHNNDTKPQPPSPETPTSSSSSRKRKQDFQFTPDHLSFPQYNYAEPQTPLALQHEKFIQSLHPDGSVGENEELMVVNFDQSNPFPRLTQPIDLDDLLQQRQAFQTWDASSSSPIQSPTRYSPGTPGFFTPGFLESLQEHQVYDHSLSMDYGSHHFNQEYNPLLVKLEEQVFLKFNKQKHSFLTRRPKRIWYHKVEKMSRLYSLLIMLP